MPVRPLIPSSNQDLSLKAYTLPGETAGIRFFKLNSVTDFEVLRSIIKAKGSQAWLEDPSLSKSEYRDWVGTETPNSYLFAVLKAHPLTPSNHASVRGFVYLYSEFSEKFRLKRLVKAGLLPATVLDSPCLEVSFAARPHRHGHQTGSGLMSSAVRLSCYQARHQLKSVGLSNLAVIAFINPQNEPARRTLVASGFNHIGQMLYDRDSPTISDLYRLNWRKLREISQKKLLESGANYPA